jgi:hypothetical protein
MATQQAAVCVSGTAALTTIGVSGEWLSKR